MLKFDYSIIRGNFMLNFLDVIENSSAYNIVKRDLEKSRLSHAYLFLSQDEKFLKEFCQQVCKLLINEKETKDINRNNLRVEKYIHPDVKFFGNDKSIDVKIATQIVEEADYSPFESDKKIFVLMNLQDMNEASQNKILKTIEEPPQNTYFILAASGKSRILQTILSRVKVIEIDLIEKEKLEKMLMDIGLSSQNAKIIASCSNGNATFAEKLTMDSGFIQFYNNILSMLLSLDGSKDVLRFSVIFTDKKVDKDEFFNICSMFLRDIMFIMVGKEEYIINKNVVIELKQISAKLNESFCIELIEKCRECKGMLAFNVSSTAVIDEFLFKLAEVKVKCRRL